MSQPVQHQCDPARCVVIEAVKPLTKWTAATIVRIILNFDW